MIDIHCHILWNIDDGPEDLDASLQMARAAAGAGITTIVATPHLRADFPRVKLDEIADRVDELRGHLAEQEIDLELIPGGEVGLSWALDADDEALRRASYGQQGSDILIETPTLGGPMLPSLLGQIASRGYRVILAHPERFSDLRENPGLVDQLVESGIRLQVNAEGLLANPRKSRSARAARAFCQSGLISAVASDAHRASHWRPVTVLAEAQAALPSLGGPARPEQLLRDGPAAILAGGELPAITRIQPAPRRWWPPGRVAR